LVGPLGLEPRTNGLWVCLRYCKARKNDII